MTNRAPNFRRELVRLATRLEYEDFHELAKRLIPPKLRDHIMLRLPEIYLDIQEEMAIDEARRELRHITKSNNIKDLTQDTTD